MESVVDVTTHVLTVGRIRNGRVCGRFVFQTVGHDWVVDAQTSVFFGTGSW